MCACVKNDMAFDHARPRAPDAKSSPDAAPKGASGSRPKIARLTRRQDFLLLAKGMKVFTASFVMQARARARRHQGDLDESAIRVGLTASRKVGNAVARNRAKRRMRQAASEIFPPRAQEGWDYVIIARKTILTYDYKKLKKDLANSLNRLTRIKQKDKV